jgi:uncharacterized protein YkwD
MKTKIYILSGILLVYMPMNTIGQYYKDLTKDINQVPASFGNGVSDIQSAFNNGRTNENQQLGTSLPQLTFPTNWASMNIQQRATWLINKERVDRGLKAFTGTDTNVTSIAKYYADYLLKNNKFGHNEDGLTPPTRLDKNPTVAACHEATYASENLYVTVSSSTVDIPYELEYAIYGWLYKDAGSAWGHRRCLLQTSFKDNSGSMNEEGLFGIGVATGGPYKGNFSQSWNYAELVVFEVIDPCSSWIYTPVTTISKVNDNRMYNIYYDDHTIKIATTSFTEKMMIEVYDLQGAKVLEKQEINVQGNIELSNSFKQGVYIVRIIAGDNCYFQKLIIDN